MRTYIIRRLLLVIPTVALVSLIIFFIIRLIPGDVVDLIAFYHPSRQADVGAIREALGLDVSIPIQFGRWIGVLPVTDGSFSGILQGNLGVSLLNGLPVVDEILVRWPVTLELSLLSLIIAQAIALPVGIYSALRQDTVGDYITRTFATLCIAVPGFWLGTLIIVFPSIWWDYMPPIVFIPFIENPIGNLQMFMLPAIVLGMGMAGVTMRITRGMVLDVLRQDYIRTAWAKGLKERAVIIRHVLKNALIPVITLLGLYAGWLIGGTIIIEEIFCLPGLGRLLINATSQRDYTIVSVVLLFFAAALTLINLMVDLTYSFLDPRIHYK